MRLGHLKRLRKREKQEFARPGTDFFVHDWMSTFSTFISIVDKTRLKGLLSMSTDRKIE